MPLMLHDEVIGTFNVESPEPRAFTESDLQFLEIFSRDVAVALNTLELLVAEKATTAAASVEAIHSAVALPVDEILNDAVNVMERYIGHEPEVVERLQRILRNARDIKQVIQKVGPEDGSRRGPAAAAMQVEQRPLLVGKRVLVVDADESVRSAAHDLLERYGCVVETAHDGAEALFMVRSLAPTATTTSMIADIRLPDMTGYEFMLKLQGDDGPGAADADDRLRLRPGPLDRQGPPGRPAGGALQAVPPRPAARRDRADRHRSTGSSSRGRARQDVSESPMPRFVSRNLAAGAPRPLLGPAGLGAAYTCLNHVSPHLQAR